jgi:hypothetical protein
VNAPSIQHVGHAAAALRHAVTPTAWRGALHLNLRKARIAAPLRVGAAVTLVFVIGGLTGQHDVVGFAALGALVSAFCGPDPYPTRLGRLAVLAAGITTSVGVGAAIGAGGSTAFVGIVVICGIAGAAAYLVWALHIVGPVVFMFAAVGAESFARDGSDVLRAVAVTAAGALVGVIAALIPWFLLLIRRSARSSSAQRESLWTTLAGAPHRRLAPRAARIAIAGAVGAAIAVGLGLDHPMWAAMGVVATMQGIGYHVTIHRGVQRLLGNVGGALLAAGLLTLPLGYWSTVAAIIVLQIVAEIASTVNYTLTSLAVTPMALLLTGLGARLSPEVAVDRVLDTGVGIVTGIVIAALTISGAEARNLTGSKQSVAQHI